jgi:homocysteine S-methyltransferase
MKLAAGNPFAAILKDQGLVILDGGLATTLEDRGHDLDDDLWSARFLMEEPEAIRSVNEDFLRAGADVIATATYQATLPGLEARGMGPEEAAALIRSGVDLARQARQNVLAEAAWDTRRPHPLVAASVGPYGAYLADGSEYDGRYGLTRKELRDFHRSRWEILAGSGADLLACETLPSLIETEALLDLLDTTPDTWAWLSFCCRDEDCLWDGTPLREVARRCDETGRVAGVGINCTDPRHVPALLQEARQATSLPLIVYPNSGETYDATTRAWLPGQGEAGDFTKMAATWRTAGATVIGGCCRVGPQDITDLRRKLLDD